MASRLGMLIMCAMSLSSGAAAQTSAPANPVAIIPAPAEMKRLGREFTLQESTAILVQAGVPEVRVVGTYLAECVQAAGGLKLPVEDQQVLELTRIPTNRIFLHLVPANPAVGDEGYGLSIVPEGVDIAAWRPAGLFHAVQTIRQLLPPEDGASAAARRLPCVQITDRPRYRWRGMLLDCGRHFMTKEFVKRYIDLLAYHKLNVLHWHLTEDQGWRIEIKKYPKLTEVGAWRQATRDDEQPRDAAGRYGGFYSQDEVREIVAYAKSRYVTIVPEIELPGHCVAALAAYPELSCTGRSRSARTGAFARMCTVPATTACSSSCRTC